MKKALFISAFTFVAGILYAQVTPPPTVVPPPTTPPPTAGVPLDPFSWIMLGAGGAAAAGKYYRVRKSNQVHLKIK
jgi:hypothetical protein